MHVTVDADEFVAFCTWRIATIYRFHTYLFAICCANGDDVGWGKVSSVWMSFFSVVGVSVFVDEGVCFMVVTLPCALSASSSSTAPRFLPLSH